MGIYAGPIIDRCLNVISGTLDLLENENSQPSGDKDFVLRSLQLMTALFNAVKGGIEGSVNLETHIKTVGRCMEFKDITIKQYSFSHLGFALK